MSEPTFMCEHTETRWRVEDEHGVAIYVTKYGSGKITVEPFGISNDGKFTFRSSDPNVVLAIGRLLVAAARHCGAMDA